MWHKPPHSPPLKYTNRAVLNFFFNLFAVLNTEISTEGSPISRNIKGGKKEH